mgnify:FL=1|tara:strand:+ start:99 stop:647 length:549 start_codon:yes stop_codon:yes gene_type:complete
MPTMSEISTTVQKRDKPNDIFITPDTLIEEHYSIIKPYLRDDDLILDPCSHTTMKYYNKFKDNNYAVDWCEITEGRDFLEYSKHADCICGNPPYSIINDFLDKIIDLNPRVVSLLIGFLNCTTLRLEKMKKAGYTVVKFNLTKVHKWFGFSLLIVWIKDYDGKPCIGFDRVVHRTKEIKPNQ